MKLIALEDKLNADLAKKNLLSSKAYITGLNGKLRNRDLKSKQLDLA